MDNRFLISAAVLCAVLFFLALPASANHPLITDDTQTQGKGKTQIEMSFEYNRDNNEGAKQEMLKPKIQLSYGLIDSLDIILEVPYLFIQQTQGDVSTRNDGLGDMTLSLKWRFFGDKEGLQFALKPTLILPTGNEQMGMGNGQASSGIPFISNFDRQSYGITLIGTFVRETWCVSANAGIQHNEYGLQSDRDAYRPDIWSGSLSGQYRVMEKVWLVGEAGVTRNPDVTSDTPPVFINGGLIYELTNNIDLDVGFRQALNKPAVDYSILAGITLRF